MRTLRAELGRCNPSGRDAGCPGRGALQIGRDQAIRGDDRRRQSLSILASGSNPSRRLSREGLASQHASLSPTDLEPIQKIARSILEGAGYEVDTVSDGAEAFAGIQSKSYDLVLMDIEMPIMDGIASTKAIRALASSAKRRSNSRHDGQPASRPCSDLWAAGMNDYVGKPLKQKDFLRKLSEWLPGTRVPVLPADLPESPVPFFDQEAFESLQAMMGSERVSEWIAKFLQQLEFTFPVAAAEVPKPEAAGAPCSCARLACGASWIPRTLSAMQRA